MKYSKIACWLKLNSKYHTISNQNMQSNLQTVHILAKLAILLYYPQLNYTVCEREAHFELGRYANLLHKYTFSR